MTVSATASTATCTECGRTSRRRFARGRTCYRCYNRHHDQGTHIYLHRPTLSRRDVVEEYLLLRSEGYTRPQIAERLGLAHKSLNTALERAARAGDTRIDYRPRRVA